MIICFSSLSIFFIFFFNDTATTEIYTLSLHDALPICFHLVMKSAKSDIMPTSSLPSPKVPMRLQERSASNRSEEHTSELQSPDHLVCRLLLEKKKYTRVSPLILTIHTHRTLNRASSFC